MQARYCDPVIGQFYSNDPIDTASFISYSNIQGFARYTYGNNSPHKYVDTDGRAAVTFGFDVQGSVFGLGVGFNFEGAMSFSKQPNDDYSFQVGFAGGPKSGLASVALATGQDMITSEQALSLLSAAADTGVSATTELGFFVGTDDNPADAEDLGGTSVSMGGTLSKKKAAKAIGGKTGKVIDALPGASVSGQVVNGENGIKGVQIRVGAGAGSTIDVNSSDAKVLNEEK